MNITVHLVARVRGLKVILDSGLQPVTKCGGISLLHVSYASLFLRATIWSITTSCIRSFIHVPPPVAMSSENFPSFPSSRPLPVRLHQSSPLGHFGATLPVSFTSYALSWSSGLCFLLTDLLLGSKGGRRETVSAPWGLGGEGAEAVFVIVLPAPSTQEHLNKCFLSKG